MKKLGIYVNINKDKSLSSTKKIADAATALGFTCALFSDRKDVDSREALEDEVRFVSQQDAVIVLGGDGTILRIASAAALCGVPLLSVNLGHLGFLTELEPEDISEGLKRLYDGSFVLEKRMMLACTAKDQTYYALNDVCLQRATRTRLLKFTASVDGNFVDSMSADGVLVSSPTGSTAYSLSCGGPIVDPQVNLLIMAPICAHTLRARPFIFQADQKLTFSALSDCGFAVICDGVQMRSFDGIKEIAVSRSPYPLQLIKLGEHNFYQRLNSKFIEWNSPNGG